jgi:hypothetical protein
MSLVNWAVLAVKLTDTSRSAIRILPRLQIEIETLICVPRYFLLDGYFNASKAAHAAYGVWRWPHRHLGDRVQPLMRECPTLLAPSGLMFKKLYGLVLIFFWPLEKLAVWHPSLSAVFELKIEPTVIR